VDPEQEACPTITLGRDWLRQAHKILTVMPYHHQAQLKFLISMHVQNLLHNHFQLFLQAQHQQCLLVLMQFTLSLLSPVVAVVVVVPTMIVLVVSPLVLVVDQALTYQIKFLQSLLVKR
jgi:hypothetical protein